MNRIAVRVGTSLLCLAAVLAWWSFSGSKNHVSSTMQGIPSKAWDGGASNLKIEAETSDAAELHVYLANGEYKDGRPQRDLAAFERVDPGTHSWTIDIPAQTGGRLEFEAKDPKPGSKLTWTVTSNGHELAHETESLDQPLKAGEAFFLELELDDFANPAKPEEPNGNETNN